MMYLRLVWRDKRFAIQHIKVQRKHRLEITAGQSLIFSSAKKLSFTWISDLLCDAVLDLTIHLPLLFLVKEKLEGITQRITKGKAAKRTWSFGSLGEYF